MTFKRKALSLHERIDPASILGAVRKRMKGEGKDAHGKAGSPMMQMGLFSAAFENLPPARRHRLLQARQGLVESPDRR
jgi:hypothetical protein